jgi:hypothetical protein
MYIQLQGVSYFHFAISIDSQKYRGGSMDFSQRGSTIILGFHSQIFVCATVSACNAYFQLPILAFIV